MDYGILAFLLLIVGGMIALMRHSLRDEAQSKRVAAQSRAEGEAELLQALVDQHGFTEPMVHAWSRSPSGIALDEVSLRIALFSGLVTPEPSEATAPQAPRTRSDLRVEVWDIQQVFGVEVVVNGSTTERVSRLSQAAAMAAGGLAFGEAGAIVGGLTSGKSTRATVSSAYLRLTVDDLWTCSPYRSQRVG